MPLPDEINFTDGFDVQAVSAFDLVFAAAALVAGFVLSRMAKRAVRLFLGRIDSVPPDAAKLVARLVGITIVLIGLFVAIEALGFSWGPLGSLLILVLVVVFFAAKPLLEDLGAGLVLQVRQPFRHGDLVQLESDVGVVDEINARTVVLRTVDGHHIHLPSRRVLNAPIVNLAAEGRRLTSFTSGVEYGTDLDRAQAIAVEALAGAPGVAAEPPPEALVEEFGDSSIDISCRIWHAPDVLSALRTRDEAMRALKRAFDANGIVIAFPQRVLWTADDGDR